MAKKIAFTFDDGPNTVITPQIISLFEKYGGKATFFLIGSNINERSAHAAKFADSLGHELENHSFTHTAMTELSDEALKEELDKTDKLIENICGKKPVFFRPPYIAYDAESFKKTDKTFICGHGCDDWDEKVPKEDRVKAMLEFAEDGVIVLLHDSDYNQTTVDALREVLPVLKERGFEFVRLDELFLSRGRKLVPHDGVIYSET